MTCYFYSLIFLRQMTTVTCTRCNNTIQSKHEHDYRMCGCDNQTYVCGNTYGGLNMQYVIALTEPREEKEIPRVGTEEPKRRTTRMIDVDIR